MKCTVIERYQKLNKLRKFTTYSTIIYVRNFVFLPILIFAVARMVSKYIQHIIISYFSLWSSNSALYV